MTIKKPYTISRHKFFASEERQALMTVTEDRAIVDQAQLHSWMDIMVR